VASFKMRHPQPYDPDVYQGYYRDPHMVPEEPFVAYIHELAANGLTKTGHHGPVAAMGVSREQLPQWDSIQFVTGQLARQPLLDDVEVGTEVCIGPNADQPLWLDVAYPNADHTKLVMFASGGIAGRSYTVSMKVTTTAGQVKKDDIGIMVTK